MKLNRKTITPALKTHEGGKASRASTHQELTRSVLACMLWEKTFYEDGVAIATRMDSLVQKSDPAFVSELAVQARTNYNLRHAPLYLCALLAKYHKGNTVGRTITECIQRADELSEFLAIYWRDGKSPLSKQVKVGLAVAFQKFNEYQLAKYNRDRDIKLRDVMRLAHPRAPTKKIGKLWKKLLDDKLETPDTWEVALSAGADKKATWTRLIEEKQLGYLALLRNLRNMEQVGVDRKLVRDAVLNHEGKQRVLPFRYLAAARAAPAFEDVLDEAMQQAMESGPRMPGHTVVLVDHSGSMFGAKLSAKSDLDRFDAAAALATLIRGVGERVDVYAFTDSVVQVPPRKGMALVDALQKCMSRGNTYLGRAVAAMPKCDRLIVITDEQSSDAVGAGSGKQNYMINVASYQNGVAYNTQWTKLSGFSENVVQWIQKVEGA